MSDAVGLGLAAEHPDLCTGLPRRSPCRDAQQGRGMDDTPSTDADCTVLAAIHRLTLRLGVDLARAHAAHVDPDNTDGRAGAVGALAAVCAFIDAIPPFKEADLSLPLRALQDALHRLDESSGTPPMLRPTKEKGRPARTLDEGVLALVAAVAMEAAMRAGQPMQQAAGRVADLLHRRGYSAAGKPITAATVKNWRARLNEGPGRMDKLLTDQWHRCLAQMNAAPSIARRGPAWFVDRLPGLLLDPRSFAKIP